MEPEEHLEMVADKLIQLLMRYNITLHSNYYHRLVLSNDRGDELVLCHENLG